MVFIKLFNYYLIIQFSYHLNTTQYIIYMVNETLPIQIRNRELNGGSINYNPNPREKCVICNQVTQYKFNTHIETRGCYVEGCGQLCPSCYVSCYNTSTADTFQDYLFE